MPEFMPRTGPLNLPKTAREKLAELMAQPIVNYDPLAGAPQATRNALPELTPNPWTMGDLANIAIDFSPIVGDIKAVGDAKQQFETGHPWLGGLSALSAVPGIGDIAALMKGGAALAPLGIVAGRKAATANLNKLDEAVKMAERGLGRDEIYRNTGWWKGVDDKWRFEIDDSGARLQGLKGEGRTGIEYSGELEGGLVHPGAYSAYPDTAKIQASIAQDPSFAQKGSYSGEGVKYNKYMPQLKAEGPYAFSPTLHELQHAVQQREGFARGGSPEMFADTLRAKKEAAEAQIEMINNQMRENARIRDALDAKRFASGEDAQAIMAKMKEYENDYQNLIQMKMDVLGDAQIDLIDDPYKQYRSLAGEAEARAVQQRMNLTPMQRQARPFWQDFDVPEGQQIVRYGEGPSAMAGEMNAGGNIKKLEKFWGDGSFTRKANKVGGQQVDLLLPNGKFISANVTSHNTMLEAAGIKQPMEDFLISEGVIRSHGMDNYEIWGKPTLDQLESIADSARESGAYIDIGDPNTGEFVFSGFIENPTKRNVLSIITKNIKAK